MIVTENEMEEKEMENDNEDSDPLSLLPVNHLRVIATPIAIANCFIWITSLKITSSRITSHQIPLLKMEILGLIACYYGWLSLIIKI